MYHIKLIFSNKFFFKAKGLFFLWLIVLLIKAASVFYLSHLSRYSSDSLVGNYASFTGDAASYLDPIDNFITEGEYYWWNGEEKVYAGRMPYYGSVYFVFRMFADKGMSYDLMVIFQIMVESFAIICLSLLSRLLLKNNRAFWITFIFCTLSLYTTHLAYKLVPESLSVSCLIFFLYYYCKYQNFRKNRDVWLSALFIAFLTALKPYFSLLYLVVFIDLVKVYGLKKRGVLAIIKSTCSFSIVLIVLISPWTIRNYFVYDKVVPFQINKYAGYHYSTADLALNEFIMSWGGSIVFWDKRSAACFFRPTEHACEFEFPEYVFTSRYSYSDLEHAKAQYISLRENYTDSLNYAVEQEFRQYTEWFKEENPFRYYLISPLVATGNFIFHSGSYYLPISPSFSGYQPYQWLLKIAQSAIYYIFVIFGCMGLIAGVVRNKNSWVLIAVPVLLIGLFPFFLRATEFRYFNHAIPVLMVGSAILISLIIEVIKEKHVKSVS